MVSVSEMNTLGMVVGALVSKQGQRGTKQHEASAGEPGLWLPLGRAALP